MIGVSIVAGGGRASSTVIDKLLAISDDPFEASGIALNCVFHIPGNVWRPEFEGVRVDRYHRDAGFLLVNIAVPATFVTDDNAFNRDLDFLIEAKAFIIKAIRDAVGVAADYLQKKGVPFDSNRAMQCVEQMDRELTVEKMLAAVAPPVVKPPSTDLLARVRKRPPQN